VCVARTLYGHFDVTSIVMSGLPPRPPISRGGFFRLIYLTVKRSIDYGKAVFGYTDLKKNLLQNFPGKAGIPLVKNHN